MSEVSAPPRIALVTGSVPPAPCGVGDYTAHLAAGLADLGLDVQIVSGTRWGIFEYRRLADRLNALRPDIVHIQYPTIGYGLGLAPQTLAMLYSPAPVVVTVHEFTLAHPLRKLAVLAFAPRSALLIFVSDHERSAYVRASPAARHKSEVVKLASNIPFVNSGSRDEYRVVYFGRIAPRKGLEDFLHAARLAEGRRMPFQFEVIGTPDPGQLAYFTRLRDGSRDIPVVWTLGRPPEEVAALLATATYAYLPFPDGASERRASLLAALGNGALVLTTRGVYTPDELTGVTIFVKSPSAAVDQLNDMSGRADERRRLSDSAVQYARRFSWPEVARQHLALYRGVWATAPRSGYG